MGGKDFFFFVIKEEIKDILLEVSINKQLHAALTGMYDNINDNLFYEDLNILPLDLPLLDRSENRFVIQKKDLKFGIRRIPQKRGGIKTVIEPGDFEKYVFVSFGGIHEERKLLLAGELVTGYNNEETKYLFELFQKPIKKLCKYKFDRFFISSGAMNLYKLGYRLCDSTISQDPEYDNEPLLIKGSK
jgi:hypothetical protein